MIEKIKKEQFEQIADWKKLELLKDTINTIVDVVNNQQLFKPLIAVKVPRRLGMAEVARVRDYLYRNEPLWESYNFIVFADQCMRHKFEMIAAPEQLTEEILAKLEEIKEQMKS